jgi:hypothetical protein
LKGNHYYKNFKNAQKKTQNTIETDELNLERKVRLLENQKDQSRHWRSENVSSVPGRRRHGRPENS